MVDWAPTLVLDFISRETQAQPLISRFEGRCQAQHMNRSSPVTTQSDDPKASRGTTDGVFESSNYSNDTNNEDL